MVYCIKLQQEIETRIPFVSDTIARHFICSIVPSPREREHSKQSPRLCSIVPSPWGRENSKMRHFICSIVPSPRGREHSKQSPRLCSIVPSPWGREHSKIRQVLCSIVPSPRGREHSKERHLLRSPVRGRPPQSSLPARRARSIGKPSLQKMRRSDPICEALPLSWTERRRACRQRRPQEPLRIDITSSTFYSRCSQPTQSQTL